MKYSLVVKARIFGLLFALVASFASAAAALEPAPSPSYRPEQVVEIQLKALQKLNEPKKDSGFATVFRFTSPENREQTGPLPRFSQMIQAGFGDLILHRSHSLLKPVPQGEQTLFPVEITTRTGRIVAFVFVLRQQHEGPYKDCWMTDGVVVPEAQPVGQEI